MESLDVNAAAVRPTNKIKLLVLTGPTRAGKHTLSEYIKSKYNYEDIYTYSTDIISGLNCIKVEPEQFVSYLEKGDCTDYTLYEDGTECCVTPLSFVKDKMVYVTKPSNITWINSNLHRDLYDIKIIYCHCPTAELERRAMLDGINRSVFRTTYYSELMTMLQFEKHGKWDLHLDCTLPVEEVFSLFDEWYVSS